MSNLPEAEYNAGRSGGYEQEPREAVAGEVELVDPYAPNLRLSALQLAQDFHSKSGAFEAIKPGAPDVVKTAENFLRFLEDGDYDTTIPERAERRAPKQDSDGDNDVSQVIVLD